MKESRSTTIREDVVIIVTEQFERPLFTTRLNLAQVQMVRREED